jgi:glycosyltransferase involved in cell wall biosynthesis
MVSIGVLNFNRCAELRRTLDVLTRAVQYPDYEIIVVDNGSTDGSIEMVRSEYPQALLHEVGKNIGVSARNIEFEVAHGKYLFMFDDDTFPGTPAMVLRIVQHMEKHQDIDVLSTSYYQSTTGIMETKGWEKFRYGVGGAKGFEGIFVVEGGVCCRSATLRDGPKYDPRWLGQEGMELGLQLFQQRRNILFCPWFITLHFFAPSGRPHGRRAYVNSRQSVWMIAKHWPLLAGIPLFALLVPRRILAMIMRRTTWRQNARGLVDGFKGIKPFLNYRPKLTWRQVAKLKRFYLFLFRWA